MMAGVSLGKIPGGETGREKASAEVHGKPTAKAAVAVVGRGEGDLCVGNTGSLLQGWQWWPGTLL